MKKYLLMLLFMSCVSRKHTEMSSIDNKVSSAKIQPAFDYEGHRGCRGLMPENTIPAFLKAVDLGVTTLEMDAVITKDKQVIISHEPFFNHEITTKLDGSFVNEKEEKQLNIYGMSYAETQQYDVGMKPHPRFPNQQKIKVHKPLLADVIDSAEAYTLRNGLQHIQYNIETKSNPTTDNVYHPAPAEFVELIMKIVLAKHIENRVIIQSFDIRTLQYLHQHYPAVRTAYLVEALLNGTLQEQIKTLGFTPTIYSPSQEMVNENLMKACNAMHMQVIPWTVNDITEMKRLKILGVHGIISDYPDLFKKL